MAKKEDDPVKKIFGMKAKEIFSTPSRAHSDFHSSNAFCGSAGPEELRHFQDLIDILSDNEIIRLLDAVGIEFFGSSANGVDRDILASVLTEADREDFYREYRKLMSKK